MNPNQSKRGMTVVFAVLLVTVVFAVTFILFNITLRQLLLSLVVRDSRFAFYAADSARNCALYWDWDRTEHPYARPFGYFEYDADEDEYIFQPPTGDTLFCDDDSIDVAHDDCDSGGCVSSFTLFFAGQGAVSPCANVEVKKYFDGGNPHTVIRVNGYNVSDESSNKCPPEPQPARTVERTIITK